jgi:hypothetical protein
MFKQMIATLREKRGKDAIEMHDISFMYPSGEGSTHLHDPGWKLRTIENNTETKTTRQRSWFQSKSCKFSVLRGNIPQLAGFPTPSHLVAFMSTSVPRIVRRIDWVPRYKDHPPLHGSDSLLYPVIHLGKLVDTTPDYNRNMLIVNKRRKVYAGITKTVLEKIDLLPRYSS